jgi:hypothetical protein
MFAVRYVLPAVLILAGFVLLAVGSASNRYEGFAMCVGAGLAVLLLNVFVRIGTKGDQERDREEAARAYLAEHGHWPNETPPAQPKR